MASQLFEHWLEVPEILEKFAINYEGDGRYYGYNALEGTFLGRCLFSGLNAGQTAKDK